MKNLLLVSLLLNGCSYVPHPKGYVCVEKPPIKVTYIDYHKDITAKTVHDMMNDTKAFKWQPSTVNEKNEVIVDYNAAGHHSTASTFVVE